MKNQTANSTAESLVGNYSSLWCARKTSFRSGNELLRWVDSRTVLTFGKVRTTSYHPQCNDISERRNRTLLNILGAFEPKHKTGRNIYQRWSLLITLWNMSQQALLKWCLAGSQDFQLITCSMVLKIIALFQQIMFSIWNRRWRQHTKLWAETGLARLKQKTGSDKNSSAANLEIGDEVLVKILAIPCPHKLADKYEQSLYEKVGYPNNDIPLHVVRDGKKKLHSNHILLVSSKRTRGRPHGRYSSAETSTKA